MLNILYIRQWCIKVAAISFVVAADFFDILLHNNFCFVSYYTSRPNKVGGVLLLYLDFIAHLSLLVICQCVFVGYTLINISLNTEKLSGTALHACYLSLKFFRINILFH